MNAKLLLPGPVGDIEVLLDEPSGTPRGAVLIAHPQPLLGGSADHKVPYFIARGLQQQGWLVARPNFRGVGASRGVHDQGRGETDDLVLVAERLRTNNPRLPLTLFGFSFGAYVQTRVAQRLAELRVPCLGAVLAGMPVGTVDGQRVYHPSAPVANTLIVHGEKDDRVPLPDVLAWAGEHNHGIMVIPGTDHFFSGRLPLLRGVVLHHLAALAPGDQTTDRGAAQVQSMTGSS